MVGQAQLICRFAASDFFSIIRLAKEVIYEEQAILCSTTYPKPHSWPTESTIVNLALPFTSRSRGHEMLSDPDSRATGLRRLQLI